METSYFTICKDILNKRLVRKKEDLSNMEKLISMGSDLVSSYDKRRIIELKAVIEELESCCDIIEVFTKDSRN